MPPVAVLLLLLASLSLHAEERLWVASESVNLYDQPKPPWRRLTSVRMGQQVTVLEHGENRHRVRLDDGTEGWTPVRGLSAQEPGRSGFLARIGSSSRGTASETDSAAARQLGPEAQRYAERRGAAEIAMQLDRLHGLPNEGAALDDFAATGGLLDYRQ